MGMVSDLLCHKSHYLLLGEIIASLVSCQKTAILYGSKIISEEMKNKGLENSYLDNVSCYYLNFGFEFSVITHGIVDFRNPKFGNKRLISWQEHKLWETKVCCNNGEIA